MNKFEQLSDRFIKYEETEQSYIASLSSTAEHLVRGFAAYLGVPSNSLPNPEESRGVRFLTLGEMQGGDFKPCKRSELGIIGKVMAFAIQMPIETNDVHHKASYIIELALAKSDENFLIEVENHSGTIRVKAIDEDPEKFDPVYQAIVQVFEKRFDSSKYD